MRNRQILLFTSLLWFAWGCGATGEKPALPEPKAGRAVKKTAGLQKLYLDEMPQALTATAQQTITLEVTGNLPSPAYRLDHVAIAVRGRTITITPLAEYDAQVMAAQVLVPFTHRVELGRLAPGEYVVRFEGRSGSQEARLEVSQ